jgi:hypothetical protein
VADQPGPGPVGKELAAAAGLEQHDPEVVVRRAAQLRSDAEGDIHGRVTRNKAYVRHLQQLAVENPALAIAVGRSLNLDHIVEELLEGKTVEGVPGIGSDGAALAPNKRHRLRRWGKWTLGIGSFLLLIEAIVADGIPSAALYAWTAVGLVGFFVGFYLIMLKE